MSPRALLLFRAAVAVLLLAAAACKGVELVLLPAARARLSPELAGLLMPLFWMYLAVFAASWLLSGILLWRMPGRPEGRVLALFLALIAWLAANDGRLALLRRADAGPAVVYLAELSSPVAIMIAVAALVRFTMLFPRPLRPEDLPPGAALRRVWSWLLRPRSVWLVALGPAALAFLYETVYEALAGRPVRPLAGDAPPGLVPLMLCLLLGLLVLSVADLWTGYRRADALGRRRISWFLEGLLALTAVALVASVVKALQLAFDFPLGGIDRLAWYPAAFFAGVLALLACLTIAMFFAGALDPSLAIRRTAVLGTLGFCMVFVFAGTEQLAQEYLLGYLGLSDRLAGMLTGGTVALTFEPLKRRIETLFGRFGLRTAAPSTADAGAVTIPGSDPRDELPITGAAWTR